MANLEAIAEHASQFDVPGHAVIGTTLDGNVVYWNRTASDLFGWSAEEVIGKPITEITPSPEAREKATEIMEHLQAGQPWSGLFTMRRADGSEFTARVRDLPVHDPVGRLIGIVGVTTPAS